MKSLIGFVTGLSLLFCASTGMSKDLKEQSEILADKHFYRQKLIKLLYDNELEYRELFNCKNILFEQLKDDGGIDTSCITETDLLWISISIGPRKRPSSVYVCPSAHQEGLETKLRNLAYDSDEIKNGIIYRMGLSKGWLRKFENVFFISDHQTGVKLNCWTLNRR